ncbi:MAG: 2-phosphosulfolactate phosphatase [Candidatus Bathyarchaeia archaeon]
MISLETSYKYASRARLRGDIIIVVDVLRFSSSVVVGLAHGVEAFIPVKTLREARSLYRRDSSLILAGERHGFKPKDFHIGNSPRDFELAKLEGKRVVITTTNGTMALQYAKGSKWILVGSFLNAKAVSTVASRLLKNGGVSIVLASRNGMLFIEDFLCGGLLASNLSVELGEMDDEAMAAKLAWIAAEHQLEGVVRRGLHATYLEGIGYGEDVAFCLRRDVYDIVPFMKDGEIVSLKSSGIGPA